MRLRITATRKSSLGGQVLLDVKAGATNAWYNTVRTPGEPEPIINGDILGRTAKAGVPQAISWMDAPLWYVPVASADGSKISALTLTASFQLDVCAGVIASQASYTPLDSVYTVLAYNTWTIDASGTFDATKKWTSTAKGPTVMPPTQNQWNTVKSGSQIPWGTLSTTGTALANETWNP